MKRTIAVLAFAVVGLAVAGCSTEGGSRPAPSSTTTTTTTTVTSPAPSSTTEPPLTTEVTPTVTYQESTHPAVPTVTLRAYCEPHGSTAVTADGTTVYCSRIAATDGYVWSTSPGLVPNPRTGTPSTPYTPTTTRPYPTQDEQFIETCMVKSGHTRAQCIAEIQAGIDNGTVRVP